MVNKRVEVIPAILADTEEGARQQIERVSGLTRWIQVDVMDGDFVPNTSWADPGKLNPDSLDVNVEAHLMVSNPLAEARRWIATGASRVIVHWEALQYQEDAQDIFRVFVTECAAAGVETALALKPTTSVRQIGGLISVLDMVLCMGVDPGYSGQQFQSATLRKIEIISNNWPDVAIEVDGGVDTETGRQIVTAGASVLATHSYIFDADDPKDAINTLRGVLS